MATVTSGTVLLEARPYRPFKSSEEYLYAMREDLAEWLNILYPELMINVDNFMDRLDTGVALCKHANNVRVAAEEYITRRQARNKSMTRSMTSGLAGPILAMGNVHYLPAAKSGTFFSRDNVSNFIAWCRKSLQIFECLLFETDDLIMRKNEKHVILCLLEVARRGAKFGMLAPMLVQMERQIDREIAADNKAASQYDSCSTQTDNCSTTNQTISISNENEDYESDSEDEDNQDDGPMLVYGPQPQIITNDLKSLDEMVRDLVEKCTCPSQFPMVRVSEGKYRIGDTKVLIFVRILRSHVMVRVGGGWDTLSHYLDKHDPCRCRAQHRTSVAARLITRTNATTNGIELHKAQVFYDRSPPSTRKQSLGAVSPNTVPTTPVYATLSPSTKGALRSRSPTPQGKRVNYAIGDNLQTTEKPSLLQSPNLARRSISPSPRRLIDFKNKKQNSLDSNSSNTSNKNENTAQAALANIQAIAAVQLETLNDMKNDTIEGSNKFENVSDNGSEISDEGYRSLGLIQTNGNTTNKRISLHSQVSNEDAEINGRLEQTSSESPMSSNDETLSKQSEDVTDGTTTSKESDEPRNNFEKSGIFITDDDITVDIASNTGLRKTGFSSNLYTDDIPIISSNNKNVSSKIPRSPMPTRRKSIDNSNVTNQNSSDNIVTGLPIMSRKMPAYRSVRKLNTSTTPEPNVSTSPAICNNNNNNNNIKNNITGKETSTWSGRTNTKKRPTLNSETFNSPQMSRNTAQRASQTKYDKNGRRIKSTSQNSSVSTSPVKTSTSPLAQQILEVAGTAKNDKQIIDKMRELLNHYSKKDPSKIIAPGLGTITSSNVSVDASIQKQDVYDDFTTAWVNSNGAINLGKTTTASVTNKKLLNKRSSTISSSSSTHSNGKESLSGLSCNNLNLTASPKRERSNLGSKIPSRVQRNNTELY